MSVVEVYLEDGPPELAGSVHGHADAPPTLIWKVPRSSPVEFVPMGSEKPVMIDVETLTYHRERAPHRCGCVCYWLDQEARDAAFFEDVYDREAQLAGYEHATVGLQQGYPRSSSLC